jgi:hypothetical protein
MLRSVLIWIGTVVFVIGLVVGFTPLAADGTKCGSAFKRGNTFLMADSCDQIRSVVRVGSLALLLAGAGLAVGGLAAGQRPRDDSPLKPF